MLSVLHRVRILVLSVEKIRKCLYKKPYSKRQRHGNTLATGHRVAHIRWIIQIVGIAEAKSLKQKALSHVLRERVGIRIS